LSTDYDEIGADYLRVKALPWKLFAERHTFFETLGPLRGLRVIDVACGDGYYSRQLRDAGADVVGVDVSKEMIRLAEASEAREPRGIRYLVGDATDLRVLEGGLQPLCDIAVAQWLFDYAATLDDLRAMCRSLAGIVRPGGRFVHVGGCFDSIFHHPQTFPSYGIELEILESHGDGSRCRWTVRRDGQSVSAENTMWTPETINAELEAAGFADVQWPPAEVAPAGIAEMGKSYWTDFLQHPYFAVTCATRAS
jgi:SAM-dependent methyltransferase